MCRDAVDREGRREWGGSGLGGLPWARVCTLVAPLLGLRPHPRHAVRGLGRSAWGSKASPLCPVKTVTYVRGCAKCVAVSVCTGVRKSVRSTPWRLDFEPLVSYKDP